MRGHIRRLNEGKWLVRVSGSRDPSTGRRRQPSKVVHGGSKDAHRALTVLQAEADRNSIPIGDMSLGDLFDMWNAATMKGGVPRAATTAYSNKKRFNGYVRPGFGDRPASKIRGVEFTRLYDSLLRDRGLSPRSVHHVHAQLRAMYNWGLKRELVSINPTDNADPPRVLLPPPTSPSFVDVQAHLHLLEVEQPMLGLAFRLQSSLGLRRSEVSALRWEHVDFNNMLLHVCEGITYVPGVGVSTTATKTGLHGLAAFELDDRTVELLTWRRTEFEKIFANHGLDIPVDGYIISGDPFCQKPLLPDQLTKLFRKHCQANPHLELVRPKDLRDFTSTNLFAAGVSETAASAVLRNTPQTTARHYRAARIVEVRSATKNLAVRLDGRKK